MKCREQRMILTEVRAKQDGNLVFGYAAKFNSYSDDLGGYRELIRPGAFKRTLDNNADVRLLVNHEGIPLGRTKSGTLTLREDATGLYFECALDPSNPQVAELQSAMRRGDIDQCSFGFYVQKDSWGKDENGYPVRTIVEAELFDVSIVTIPAYPATNVALRNAHDEIKRLQDEIHDLLEQLRAARETQHDAQQTTEDFTLTSDNPVTETQDAEDSGKVAHSTDDQTATIGLSAQARENEIQLLDL